MSMLILIVVSIRFNKLKCSLTVQKVLKFLFKMAFLRILNKNLIKLIINLLLENYGQILDKSDLIASYNCSISSLTLKF